MSLALNWGWYTSKHVCTAPNVAGYSLRLIQSILLLESYTTTYTSDWCFSCSGVLTKQGQPLRHTIFSNFLFRRLMKLAVITLFHCWFFQNSTTKGSFWYYRPTDPRKKVINSRYSKFRLWSPVTIWYGFDEWDMSQALRKKKTKRILRRLQNLVEEEEKK